MSELNKDNMKKINVASTTITYQMYDYDGNKTMNLGLNNIEDLYILQEFVQNRILYLHRRSQK